MKRLLCLAGLLIFAACEEPAGPPAFLIVDRHNPARDGGALQPKISLEDSDSRATTTDSGTLEYVVYEGLPKRGVVRCRVSVPITRASFTEQTLVSFGEPVLALHPEIPKPTGCKPLPSGEVTFGVFSLTLPDGRRLEDRQRTFVHPDLGGFGKLVDPYDHEIRESTRESNAKKSAARKGLVDKLAAAATAKAGAGPCPADVQGAYWRADRRALGELAGGAKMRRDLVFEAVNFPDVDALVRRQAGERLDRKVRVPRGLSDAPPWLVVVDVQAIIEPKINSSPRGDKKGTYTPGSVAGEVTVVELATGKARCSGPFLGVGKGGDVTTKKGETSMSWLNDTVFIGTVSASVHQGAQKVAPGLRFPERPKKR
jgi:hypothetical protein